MSFLANIEGDTWQEKLQFSIECNCCIRHNIDKPQTLSMWTELPISNNKIKNECKCPCRHNARFICRIFNYTKCPKYSEWKNNQKYLSDENLTD